MTDAQLAEYAKEYDRVNAAIKKAEEKKDKLKGRILKEMERRGTRAIEHDGIRVTYVQQEYTEYDVDQLKERLTPRLFKRVTRPVVDKQALLAEVQTQRIPLEDVDACARVVKKNPYPLISHPK